MNFLHENEESDLEHGSDSSSDSSSDEEEEDYDDNYLQRMVNREADTASVLSRLFLSKEEMEKMQAQLTNYLYADDADDLRSGLHVRWICLKNPEKIELKKGAIFCSAGTGVKEDPECCMCVCKTYMHRHVQFCFDDCLVFQKIDARLQQLFDLLEFVR